MAVHWRIQFSSINSENYTINIYDDTWKGAPEILTGAPSPIIIEEDDDENILCPVRIQTGTLSIINNDSQGDVDIESIMPETITQRYVELLQDSTLVWRGYIQPVRLTDDWDCKPVTRRYSLISPLGILDSIRMTDTIGLAPVRFAQLINEALSNTGVAYSNIIHSDDWSEREESDNDCCMFYTGVSRANFFTTEDNEDTGVTYNRGITYLQMLEEIAKTWGVTIREQKDKIYILGHHGSQLYSLTYSQLTQIAAGTAGVHGTKYSRRSKYLSTESFASTGHKADSVPAVSGIRITTNLTSYEGALLPDVADTPMVVKSTNNYALDNKDDGYKLHAVSFAPGNGNANIKFHTYSNGKQSFFDPNTWRETQWQYNQAYNMGQEVSATWGKHDIYEQKDITSGKKYNYDLQNGFIIGMNYRGWFDEGQEGQQGEWRNSAPTREEAASLPIITHKSTSSSIYQNGALCISGSIKEIWIGGVSTPFWTYIDGLLCTLRIGEKYWNGSAWVSKGYTAPTFVMPLDDAGIKNTKTITQNFTCTGYVMPISSAISGDIELTIYAPDKLLMPEGANKGLLQFSNLRLEYISPDTAITQAKQIDTLSYHRDFTGGQDFEELSLTIGTSARGQIGFGMVLFSNLQYAHRDFYPLWRSDVQGLNLEQGLLDIYEKQMRTPSSKLTVDIVMRGVLPTDQFTDEYDAPGGILERDYDVHAIACDYAESTETLTLIERK